MICKLWGVELDAVAPKAGDFIEFGFPNIGPPFYPFTWEHPLGLATNTGTDNLAFLLYGLRTSLIVASIATLLTTVIGVTVGLIAGYAHGWLDRTISFIIDTFLSFPFLLGALAIAPILTSHFATDEAKLAQAQFFALIAVLTIFSWMGPGPTHPRSGAVAARARVRAGRSGDRRAHQDHPVERTAAQPHRADRDLDLAGAAGVRRRRRLALPYLGIGLTGRPSLGQMILRASDSYSIYPLYLLAPIVVVAVLVLSLNLLGDSIRDAFDPKTRR